MATLHDDFKELTVSYGHLGNYVDSFGMGVQVICDYNEEGRILAYLGGREMYVYNGKENEAYHCYDKAMDVFLAMVGELKAGEYNRVSNKPHDMNISLMKLCQRQAKQNEETIKRCTEICMNQLATMGAQSWDVWGTSRIAIAREVNNVQLDIVMEDSFIESQLEIRCNNELCFWAYKGANTKSVFEFEGRYELERGDITTFKWQDVLYKFCNGYYG